MQKQISKKMVSASEAAAMFSTSPGTLGNWRSKKVGPRFFKVGRSVRYRISDLENFFTSTPVLTVGCRPTDMEG